MHLRCSSTIQKQVSKNILHFADGITFSELMFQIFIGILLLKLKTLSLHNSVTN
jgi:hypothetical protein